MREVPNNVSTSCVVVLPFHCGDRGKEKGTIICLLCLSRFQNADSSEDFKNRIRFQICLHLCIISFEFYSHV